MGYRPVIVFRPSDPDQVKCPRSTITASAGRLTLMNVAMELQVPREVAADNWSLVETRGDQVVELKKCTLSIDNASAQLGAYHQDVAFFRVKAALGADTVVGDGAAASATAAAAIELVDCIACGEAVFLRAEDLQPVGLSWHNGLLATSEWLLWASGGTRTPQAREALQLDLRHLTAAVRSGMCRVASNGMGPHPLPLQVSCADSILLGRAGSPLIEQVGEGEIDDLRQHITWNGDRNCYDGFDVFWSIDHLDSDIPPERMTFEGWKSHWGPEHENLPRAGAVEWRKLPPADQPVHRSTPDDFALNEASAGNPAVGAASDGRNLGFQAERPAPTPAKPAPTKPPRREDSRRRRRRAIAASLARPLRPRAELTWAELLLMLWRRGSCRRAISSIG